VCLKCVARCLCEDFLPTSCANCSIGMIASFVTTNTIIISGPARRSCGRLGAFREEQASQSAITADRSVVRDRGEGNEHMVQ